MTDKSSSRVTQVLDRKNLQPKFSGDSITHIIRMIENGDEASRIYAAIAECAANTPGVTGSAIYLPSDTANAQLELFVSHGNFVKEEDRRDGVDASGRMALQAATSQLHKTTSGVYNYFDMVCLGAPLGYLAVIAPDGLTQSASEKLHHLAHNAGVVFERHRLSNTLQHFLDRVQVLNELNQLIVSNVGLQRIVKSLARESAFRFAADISLAFLLDEDKTCLEAKGGYGCTPSIVPARLPINAGILGQVMRLGGHLSVVNLANHSNHGLDFIEEIGIKSIDACCLEVRGEPLGALLIGFRRETIISPNDLTRFEEFSQGAAVAIANARTQERVTAYTERLEDLVNSRTADLAIQTARAEEANQAKSQFLANMSHELRTPLTAIVGYSSVLADGIFGPLNDKQIDALHAVTRSSEHLKNLIDDVLNLARIESGKEQPEPAKVSVKDLLIQTHKLILQTALGKGIAMQPLQIPEELAETSIFCDPKHIYQIVINLMSNAIKYTPKGGKVSVSIAVVVDKVKISVTDTGVGIPPNKLEVLFERFERGEDTYSKSQEGTGIGLNLTRKLVELNGGRIGVESKVNEGSTFWIMMPIASEESASVTAQEAPDVKFRLDGLSTLVVDDNRDTCEVLKHILIASGATVRAVHSVKEGIAELANGVPDIVLTDLAMPGESGIVLIQHIRNSANHLGNIPVIVLSACAFQSDRDMAISAGASLFIPKPFRPNEIIRNVRQLTLNAAMGN